MQDKPAGHAMEEAVNRIIDLEAELEASGNAATQGDALARSREILHRWVDSVTGIVTTPGVGRVVLIHDNGHESRIASSELGRLLSAPVSFERPED